MKTNSRCNYLGADWIYVGKEPNGIRLKSINKHLADVVVSFSRKNTIKDGHYNSRGRR